MKKWAAIGACVALYILIVAISRIYLGHHWLSDVIGGGMLGGGFGFILFVPFIFFYWLWYTIGLKYHMSTIDCIFRSMEKRIRPLIRRETGTYVWTQAELTSAGLFDVDSGEA